MDLVGDASSWLCKPNVGGPWFHTEIDTRYWEVPNVVKKITSSNVPETMAGIVLKSGSHANMYCRRFVTCITPLERG